MGLFSSKESSTPSTSDNNSWPSKYEEKKISGYQTPHRTLQTTYYHTSDRKPPTSDNNSWPSKYAKYEKKKTSDYEASYPSLQTAYHYTNDRKPPQPKVIPTQTVRSEYRSSNTKNTSTQYVNTSRRTGQAANPIVIGQTTGSRPKTQIVVSNNQRVISKKSEPPSYKRYDHHEKGRKNSRNYESDDEICEEHEEKIYKKKKKCFGYYECTCGRYWESACSWVGYGQNCTKCKELVYPYCQHALKVSGKENDPNKHHQTSLCEKCKKLGGSCINNSDYENEYF